MLQLPRTSPLWIPEKVKASPENKEVYDRGLYDFEFFIREFFEELIWGEFSPLTQDLVDLEKDPLRRGRYEVIAAPRGNAKTSLRTTIKTIHSIVYRYQPFTVIIGYSAKEAEDKLKDIITQLQTNERLIEVFGLLVNKSAGQKDFTTTNGCRVLARSRGGQIRGIKYRNYRPTRIVLDDVEDLEACQSPLQREKVDRWFKKDVYPCRQKGGEYKAVIETIGTILHEESLLANELRSPIASLRKKYKSVVSWSENQALWDKWEEIYRDLDNESADVDALDFFEKNKSEMLKGTEVLWPEGEPYYDLMIEKLGIGTAAFFSEKQNEPFDPDSQILDPSLCARFKVYTPESPEWLPSLGDEGFAIVRGDSGKAIHSRDMKVIAFWDPALGRKSKQGKMPGDYAAIVVCAQDLSGYIYVLDVWLKKAKPDVQVKKSFGINQQWDLFAMYLEEVGFQELLRNPVAEEQKLWSKPMRVIGVGQHSDKIARIVSMQPYFENKWLLFNENLDPEFINQLRLFPTVNDDGPDALEGCLRQLKKPRGYIGVSAKLGEPANDF